MAEPVRARRLTDQEGRRLLQIVRRGKHGPVRTFVMGGSDHRNHPAPALCVTTSRAGPEPAQGII
jgi:hypothetical protein